VFSGGGPLAVASALTIALVVRLYHWLAAAVENNRYGSLEMEYLGMLSALLYIKSLAINVAFSK
jgi:hypothetical protein